MRQSLITDNKGFTSNGVRYNYADLGIDPTKAMPGIEQINGETFVAGQPLSEFRDSSGRTLKQARAANRLVNIFHLASILWLAGMIICFILLVSWSNSASANILMCYEDDQIYKYPVFFMNPERASEIAERAGDWPTCSRLDEVIKEMDQESNQGEQPEPGGEG